MTQGETPFTIDADFNLGEAAAPWCRAHGQPRPAAFSAGRIRLQALGGRFFRRHGLHCPAASCGAGCSLIAFIDNATSRLLALRFVSVETHGGVHGGGARLLVVFRVLTEGRAARCRGGRKERPPRGGSGHLS